MIYYLGVFLNIQKIICALQGGGRGVPTIGHQRELGTIFKVIFQGLFLEFFLDMIGGPLGF